MDLSLGYETWEEAQPRLLPLLKPRSYLEFRFRQPEFARE